MTKLLVPVATSLVALTMLATPAHAGAVWQFSTDHIKAVMLTPQQAGAAAGVAGVALNADQPLSCARQRGGNYCNVGWRIRSAGLGPSAVSVWSFPSAAKAKALLRSAATDTTNYFMTVVSSTQTQLVTTVSGTESGLGTDSVDVFLRRGADVAGASCSRPTTAASIASLTRCARAVAGAQLKALH